MGQSKKNEESVFRMSQELDPSYPSTEEIEIDREREHLSDFESSEIFDDTAETDECPRCGFVRQNQQSDDHVVVPDLLRDIPSDSKKHLKLGGKVENKHSKTQGNTNPFLVTHDNVTDANDIEKVEKMSKIAGSIHVGSVRPSAKGATCLQFKAKNQNCHFRNNNNDISEDFNITNNQCRNQIPLTKLNGRTIDQDSEIEWNNEVTENVKISNDISCFKSATASPVDQSCFNYEVNLRTDYPEVIEAYSRVTGYEDYLEKQSITQAMKWLKKGSMYYGKLTMQEARRKLKKSSVGTFLLRDSSDPKYFLSLSVKTHRGTTSIRISHNRGRFRLDCEETAFLKIPSFDCIMKLIQHYTDTSKDSNQNNCVFLESSGRKDTPVLLRKPYLENPLSLQHLCRIKLNQLMTPEQRRRWLIFMEPKIEQYMTEYPYFV